METGAAAVKHHSIELEDCGSVSVFIQVSWKSDESEHECHYISECHDIYECRDIYECYDTYLNVRRKGRMLTDCNISLIPIIENTFLLRLLRMLSISRATARGWERALSFSLSMMSDPHTRCRQDGALYVNCAELLFVKSHFCLTENTPSLPFMIFMIFSFAFTSCVIWYR